MSKNVYIFFRTRTLHLLYPQHAPASLLAVNDMMQKNDAKKGLCTKTYIIVHSLFFYQFGKLDAGVGFRKSGFCAKSALGYP